MVRLGDATWHPKNVTLGKIHMVHLNEWLTMSHVWEKKFHGSHEAMWVMMS